MTIQKIKRKKLWEKVFYLNSLLEPLGFIFEPECDLICSKIDAWQRQFGYALLYDKTAFYFNMVIDCEPIYFNYKNKTWLIELWKGQYGINTGAEVGIYYAKSLISEDKYEKSLFKCVQDDYIMPIDMEVIRKNRCLFRLSKYHWWLAGFIPGVYSEPEDLKVKITIYFPDIEMSHSFIEAMKKIGYTETSICLCGTCVSFIFEKPYSKQYYMKNKYTRKIAQRINKFFCYLYRYFSRPFVCTHDRILYFYYYLPYMFRYMVKIRNMKTCKYNRRNRKKI